MILKNKKGFYFTLIVLFCIILLLLISFQIKREYYSEGIKTRIITTNNFIKGIEQDASRAVYISSYRTMVAVINYVVSKHDYLRGEYNENPITVNGVFADALFNGSLNYSLGYLESQGILANGTLKDWQEQTSDLARATNLELDFEEIDSSKLTVTQTDPWNIIISIPINYNLSDPISGVTWNRKTQINTSLSIVNTFEDPIYVIEFGSACGNKILKNDYTPLVNESCDIYNLTQFFDTPGKGSKYVASISAPSYLDRLTGELDCFRQRSCTNENGIESMINPPEWADCGALNGASTIVDFRYNYIDGEYHVTNAQYWIYLNESDFAPYGIPEGCKS